MTSLVDQPITEDAEGLDHLADRIALDSKVFSDGAVGRGVVRTVPRFVERDQIDTS